MKKLVISLFIFMLLPICAFSQTMDRLFIIERSKNANIVCYDVNLDSQGQIVKEDPVKAYWLLYAEKNGEMEKLSIFDKKAYGFKVEYNEQNKNYDFSLKAVEDKQMTIDMYANIPKVTIQINDKKCFLEKVYISSKDGAFGIPKVSFYTLYGEDVLTGNKVEQKIVLKK
ncbi:MAG: DUF4833 domain-containing protein [Endomicrobiia bacterium]